MNKHTPAPWQRFDEGGHNVIGAPGDVLVADVPCDDEEPQRTADIANARLITAAPDLLTAIQELIAAYDAGSARGLADAVEHARVTVAEATTL